MYVIVAEVLLVCDGGMGREVCEKEEEKEEETNKQIPLQ